MICTSEYESYAISPLVLTRCRVANTLLSIILKSHKVNDALLLSTILSTDLRSLRRRGYNGKSLKYQPAIITHSSTVDRVIRHQKAQRAAQEAEAQRQADQAKERQGGNEKLPGAFDDSATPPPFSSAPVAAPPAYQQEPPVQEKDDSLFGRLRRLSKRPSKPDLPSSSSPRPPPLGAISEFPSQPPPLPPRPASHFSPSPAGIAGGSTQRGQGTIDHRDIQSNVKQAIMACRPTSFSLLQNRSQMTVSDTLLPLMSSLLMGHY